MGFFATSKLLNIPRIPENPYGADISFYTPSIQMGFACMHRVGSLASAPTRRESGDHDHFESRVMCLLQGSMLRVRAYGWNFSANVRMCKCITRNALTHSPSPNFPSLGIEPGSISAQSGRLNIQGTSQFARLSIAAIRAK